MKFNLDAFKGSGIMEPLQIGDVFPAKGGARTRLWVVIAIPNGGPDGNMVHALGVDMEGAIVSTTTYARRVFEERDRIGHVDLSELELRIKPL